MAAPRLTDIFSLTRPQWRAFAIAYAAAIAAGTAFLLLGLPLPWLLGPLTLAILLATTGRPLAQPTGMMHPMRSFIGVAVGSSFGPDVLSKMGAAATSLALLVPYTLLITGLGFVMLKRLAKFDTATAFFGAAPGGLADMLTFAMDAKADLRRVSLIQVTRVVVIVFTLPFWLQFIGGLPLGGAMPSALHIWQIGLVDAAVVCLIAWGGWRIADKLGIMGASIVGPMLLSAAAHATGLTGAKVPVELIVLTQVGIGLVVGGQFKGITMHDFIGVMSWGLAYAVLLLLIAAGMALGIGWATGLDPTSLLLSYAPGGQNEMAIIGLILGIDVALIAMHHLVRVIIVVLSAQWVHRIVTAERGKSPT